MNGAEKQKTIIELKDFHKKLKSYGRLLDPDRQLSEAQKRYRDSLREILQRKIGNHKDIINQLTGRQFYKQFGTTGEIWAEGLRTSGYLSSMRFALTMCIDVTNEAIGKLESDIQIGTRDKQGNLIKKPQIFSLEPPKAFISHGKGSTALNKLEEFLHTLGVEPLIVKEQPSLDKTVDDKVNYYLSQADFVVILATGDDEFKGKLHPRQNVIHEIGLAQKSHSGKIIYLLEEGAEFPSNINPKVWEHFRQRNMLNAFLCIIRELRALSILLAVKEQT